MQKLCVCLFLFFIIQRLEHCMVWYVKKKEVEYCDSSQPTQLWSFPCSIDVVYPFTNLPSLYVPFALTVGMTNPL